MAVWVWNFLFYSFGGYLLEKWFAHRTHAEKTTRKCLLLLPLCPVYGLGVTAVLALPEALRGGFRLILVGAVVTTAVEYAVHWAYETFLNVKFWDYTGARGNLRGRVCLRFTAAWGILSAAAIWLFQPLLDALTSRIPPAATFAMILMLTADAVCSARVLYLTHDTESLHLRTLRQA